MLPAMALPKAVPDFGSLNPQEISQEIPRIRQCIIRNMRSCNLRDDNLYICEGNNSLSELYEKSTCNTFSQGNRFRTKTERISNRF